MGSIVLEGKKGSIVLENLQNHGLKDTRFFTLKLRHPTAMYCDLKNGLLHKTLHQTLTKRHYRYTTHYQEVMPNDKSILRKF
jgi:hypothetical protein